MQVLIIDDHPEFRELLSHHITAEWPDALVDHYDPVIKGMIESVDALSGYDVVMLDHNLGRASGLQWLLKFKQQSGCPPVIFMTGEGDELLAVAAIKAGADDYIPKSKMTNALLVGALRECRRGKRAATVAGPLSPPRTRSRSMSEFAVKGYELLDLLATGHGSSIYRARARDGGMVVLKVLQVGGHDDSHDDLLDRFLLEYEVISELHHPNIAAIHSHGVCDDHAYIAIEYFPYGDLQRHLRRGAFEPLRALHYLRQMAEGLRAMHTRGVLHRDLKPANVMMRDGHTLALIDFGLAKFLDVQDEPSTTGEVLGTPYYMSPEQGAADSIDERSDLYSLGVICYEMLTGRKPFAAASPRAVLYKHSHAAVPGLPGDIANYQPLVDCLMAKRPADRPASAGELLKVLNTL